MTFFWIATHIRSRYIRLTQLDGPMHHSAQYISDRDAIWEQTYIIFKNEATVTRFGRDTPSPQDSSTDHGKWCQASQFLRHAFIIRTGKGKRTDGWTDGKIHTIYGLAYKFFLNNPTFIYFWRILNISMKFHSPNLASITSM